MGIISKIKDYWTLRANERVNKMYIENPEMFISKLEKDKTDSLGRITETASRILHIKSSWSSELSKIDSNMSSLDSRIRSAVAEGNTDTANILAISWKEQNRLKNFYEDAIKKMEAKYKELVSKHREIALQYDSRIQTAKTTLCSYAVNKEILHASSFLNGINMGDAEIFDISDLIKTLNDENNKIESKLQVITDFNVGEAPKPVAAGDTSALDEWKKSH